MESWNKPRFQLTVHKVRNVISRGKAGTNDSYVVVSFGDEKHKTSVKEKTLEAEWNEDCFIKLLSTNESLPLKVKLCHRNFFRLDDETIGEVEIILKQHDIYEGPQTSWFPLKSKWKTNKDGEILLTLAYHVTTPTLFKTGLTKTSSLRNITSKFGKRFHSKKNWSAKRASLAEIPRYGSSDVVTVNYEELSESFKETNNVSPIRDHYSHRNSIDFSSLFPSSFDKKDNSIKKEETQMKKTLVVPDKSLSRFDSDESIIEGKDPFSDSNSIVSFDSSNTTEILNESEKFEEEAKMNDVENILRINLSQFTKQELVQLVIEQRDWIRNREMYVLDLHTYLNDLLAKVLNSNCALLQKTTETVPVHECHKLTTFKTEETSFAKRWLGALFKQKS